jgi:hypothetical protein
VGQLPPLAVFEASLRRPAHILRMNNADRFKLLFGPYPTPRIPLGHVLTCEARDCDVIVVGYSDAPIPWPIGQRRSRGARALVVYGALADAIRREANQAVAYW